MRTKATFAFLIMLSITMTFTSYVLFKQKYDSDMAMKSMEYELNKIMQEYTILKDKCR